MLDQCVKVTRCSIFLDVQRVTFFPFRSICNILSFWLLLLVCRFLLFSSVQKIMSFIRVKKMKEIGEV